MIVEQAFYGATSTGHGLLKASPSMTELAPTLAWRMDLPGTAPPGITWGSYLSGFANGDYYVVARTLPDPKASRPGMVFSHALFLPLQDAIELDDLGEFFERLTHGTEVPSDVPALEFEFANRRAATPNYAGALAETWLDPRPGPLVILGLDNLPEAAAFLWSRLWPDARRNFSFRLSFGPQDVEGTAPTLVGTPPTARLRWTGHKMVDPDSASSNLTSAAAAFAGLAAGEQVLTFGRALDHRPTSGADFKRLADAWAFTQDESGAVDPLLAAATLYRILSPEPTWGLAPKSVLVKRITLAVPRMTAGELGKLATLDLSAFADATPIYAAITAWVSARVAAPTGRDAGVFASAAHPKAQPDWAHAVWGGLQASQSADRVRLADAVWMWLSAQPEIAPALIFQMTKVSGLVAALADRAPSKIAPSAGNAVESAAAANGLWLLYGAAASAWREAKDAVRRQLDADPQEALDGVRAAARHATAQDRLALALARPVDSTLTLAGEAAALDPSLLRAFDASSPAWQSIWVAALKVSPAVWQGPERPAAALHAIFDLQLEGHTVVTELLQALSLTPLANVLDYVHRDRIWRTLPASARPGFLNATARGWLDRAAKDPALATIPEAELIDAICEPEVLGEFEAVAPIDSVVAVYVTLAKLGELQFLGWLEATITRTRATTLSPLQAAQLGQLIANRGWDRTANYLLNLMVRDSRPDLRPAVMAAANLIGFVDRYLNGLWDFGALGIDAKWQVLATVAADLYPSGPDHDAIWSRSGGHNADLPYGHNGRDRWMALARRMQHGATNVEPADLLTTMRRDYLSNQAVAQLSREPEFAPRPKRLKK